MPDDFQSTIEQRARVIATFKEELIRRLNLPYSAEDLHEDISLLGSGLGLDSLDALAQTPITAPGLKEPQLLGNIFGKAN